MKFKDIVVGVKIRHVGPLPNTDKIGIVKQIIGQFFYVYEVGSNREIGAGWCDPNEWEKYVVSRPMLSSDRQIGTKVVCVTTIGGPNTYGRSGIITSVDYSSYYTVTDDYGDIIGGVGWNKLASFEVIMDMDPINPSATVELQVAAMNAGPDPVCPSYYWGASHCVCGNHNNKMKFIFQ